MNRLLAALVFALAFVSCAVSAQALNVTPIDGIVAVVDEDVILRSELQRAVSNILNQYADTPQQLPPRDVLEKQVLERLIVLRLQVQRAQGSGIRIADGEVDQTIRSIAQQNNIDVDQLRAQLAADGLPYEEFRQTLRDELTAQRLRQNISQSRVSVSDTEIDLLLANNQFSQGQVNASLLLVALPENATQEQIETAQRKVEGIHDLIVRGEMDFKAAAIRYSDAPNALDGGDLGWRSYDEVPSMFTDLIQGMAVGEMTPPMRGPTGFHLVRVND
ncbi:MAG: SurA N-terminal domain-containing protein [Lysobacteraceae bacterium]